MKILIQSCQTRSLKFFFFEPQMIIQQSEPQPHGTLRMLILSPVSLSILSTSIWLVHFSFFLPRQIRPGCTMDLVSTSQRVFPVLTLFRPQWLPAFWSLCGWIGPGSGPWSESHMSHLIDLISSGLPTDHLRDGECSLSLGPSVLSTCKDASRWQEAKPSR